jgi:hypothetical protein
VLRAAEFGQLGANGLATRLKAELHDAGVCSGGADVATGTVEGAEGSTPEQRREGARLQQVRRVGWEDEQPDELLHSAQTFGKFLVRHSASRPPPSC